MSSGDPSIRLTVLPETNNVQHIKTASMFCKCYGHLPSSIEGELSVSSKLYVNEKTFTRNGYMSTIDEAGEAYHH